MTHTLLIFIAAVFLLAGFVKGVIGLGLPTVSMGLLAVSMPPAHALAIVIVPGVLTNIWQTFAGPYFLGIVKRLWPLLLGLAVGIRLDGNMMTGPYARYGTVLIGVLLVTYAIVSLRKFTVTVRPQDEKWVGGVIGLTTGVISGIPRRTGTFTFTVTVRDQKIRISHRVPTQDRAWVLLSLTVS